MIRSITVKRLIVLCALMAAVSVMAGGCGGGNLAGAIVRTTDTVIKTTAPATTTEAPVSDKINITAVPSKTTVKAGDSFDVSIRITSDKPSRGVQFLVTWDPAKVTCTSAEQGSYYKDFAATNNGDIFILPSSNLTADNAIGQFPKLTASAKQFMLAMTGAQGTGGVFLGPSGTGDVVVLHMTAKGGGSGSVDFKLTNVKLGDATINSDNLNPKINNCQIAITS